MKTIDEIIDIMHSPESSDSAVLWAGSKFDALSKEEVQSLYQRGVSPTFCTKVTLR